MYFREKLESIIIIATILICILIPVTDFTGALDAIPWLSNRIPIITLLAIGSFALYFITERSKDSKKLEAALKKGNDEILRKISLDETNQKIVEIINGLWSERELDVQNFLDQIAIKAASDDLSTLKRHLHDCQLKFNSGDIMGTKLKYPWDVNITAINLKGDLIFHINDEMIATRVTGKYPYSEVLKKRSGVLFWFNNTVSERFKATLPYKSFKLSSRFTKICFRELGHLQAIVAIEHHIYVLSQLPKETQEPKVQ